MLCTIPLVHFCVHSFSGYASYSDAYFLFDVQIGNMSFFAPMFQQNYFTYIMLSMYGLTSLYLLAKPKDNDQFGDPLIKVRTGAQATPSRDAKKARKSTEMVSLVDRGANKL